MIRGLDDLDSLKRAIELELGLLPWVRSLKLLKYKWKKQQWRHTYRQPDKEVEVDVIRLWSWEQGVLFAFR